MAFLGRTLQLIGLLLAVGVVVLLGVAAHLSRVLLSPIDVDTDTTLTVEAGTRFGTMATRWQQAGYVKDAGILKLYGRLSGDAARIKAGEYALTVGTTPLALLRTVVRGISIHHTITFVEGWTFRQIRQALTQVPRLRQSVADLTDAQIMERLGFPAQHPEGRFFPDTYHFSSGQTDLSVLANAHSAMRQYLDAAWLHRAPQLPYESPDEALIMASIVEKETGAAHERPAIAGVFVRRLRKNMRLQTDPTVIYGLGERFDGNLRRRDLREDTPYNTYVHKGLPPTPIANPGGAAVDAALHPLKGTALYFVAKGNGTHKFSDTYAQHKRAVALYQLKRKGTGS